MEGGFMNTNQKQHWSDLLTNAKVEALPSEIVLFLDQLEARISLPEELGWQDGDDRLAEWLMLSMRAGYLKLERYNNLRDLLSLHQELPKLHFTEAV
jgi:hypothetical protein